MGELLGADLDELRSLGAQLRSTANELADVAVPARTSVAAVAMPDAGIDDMMGRISTTFETAVAKHRTAVQTLADGATSSAATYEAVEDAFSRQLSALTEGLGR